jgi:iron complex outermembrane receptor protein
LGGNYAWIDGQFDSDGDSIVDSDLDGTNIAPNRINLFAQFYPTSWMNGRLQFSGFFDRRFEGPGAPRNANFGGYGLVDLLLGFPTKAGLIRFGVENLLDRQYLTYFSQTEPFQRNDTIFAGRGRTFTIVFEPRLFGR